MKKLILVSALLICLVFVGGNKREQTNFNGVIFLNSDLGKVDDDFKSAYEYLYNTVSNLIDGIDFSELESEFSGFEFLEGVSVKEKILSFINGDYQMSASEFVKNVFDCVLGGLSNYYGYFALICALALLVALLDSIKPSFMDKTLHNLTAMVCLAVVVGLICGIFGSIYQSVTSSVYGLERQSDIIFPILLTLMTASGGNASANVLKPQVVFLAKGMTAVVRNILLPIILLIFVFNSIGALSSKYNFDKAKQFLKTVFKWVSGLTVIIFNFLVTVQGISASIYDGISVKTLKYALGNSIPFVSGLVSSGFDTVMSSMLLIKNAVGGFALVVMMWTVLYPIIKIAVFSLFLRFSCAVIEPICDKRISGFLSSVADSLGYLTAVSVISCSSYFLTVLLVICSVGGGG